MDFQATTNSKNTLRILGFLITVSPFLFQILFIINFKKIKNLHIFHDNQVKFTPFLLPTPPTQKIETLTINFN